MTVELDQRDGPAWFFHHGMWGAGRGVQTVAPMRVYVYRGEQRLRRSLAHWADDDGATPTDATAIAHFVDADGVEVGSYPLDGFGEPVTVGRALREWGRLTGVTVRAVSDVVMIGGRRATHYGVRVV